MYTFVRLNKISNIIKNYACTSVTTTIVYAHVSVQSTITTNVESSFIPDGRDLGSNSVKILK